MKELPILFSTPMVQALLEGRKTMTRRIKGLEGINKFSEMGYRLRYDSIEDGPDENGYVYFEINDHKGNPTEKYCKAKPKYYIGDLLWVKETSIFCLEDSFLEGMKSRTIYKASIHEDWFKALKEAFPYYKWTPSIFMPKSSARIWLRVTDVKCERLQDINGKDAIAEGIKPIEGLGFTHYTAKKIYTKEELKDVCPYFNSPILSFLTLWESINGEENMQANPWVFAYTFEIISTTGKPHESQI